MADTQHSKKAKKNPFVDMKTVKGYGARKEEVAAESSRQATGDKRDPTPSTPGGKAGGQRTRMKARGKPRFEDSTTLFNGKDFVSGAVEGIDLSFGSGKVQPAEYLQVGGCIAERQHVKMLQALSDTGSQKPKQRTKPIFIELMDAHGPHALRAKTYIEEKIPVLNVNDQSANTISLTNTEEFKKRIGSMSITDAKSICRMFSGSHTFEQEDGSRSRVAVYMADILPEVFPDPNPGIPHVGGGGVLTGRAQYSRGERLEFMTEIGPREASIMIFAVVTGGDFDVFRTAAASLHFNAGEENSNWVLVRYEPFRQLFAEPSTPAQAQLITELVALPCFQDFDVFMGKLRENVFLWNLGIAADSTISDKIWTATVADYKAKMANYATVKLETVQTCLDPSCTALMEFDLNHVVTTSDPQVVNVSMMDSLPPSTKKMAVACPSNIRLRAADLDAPAVLANDRILLSRWMNTAVLLDRGVVVQETFRVLERALHARCIKANSDAGFTAV